MRLLFVVSPRTMPKQGSMPISTRRGSSGCECGGAIHFIPGLRGGGRASGALRAPTAVAAASLDGSLPDADVYDTKDCIKIE